MTQRERHHLIRLIHDPPPGSRLAAAKEFGIDLTLLLRRLEMTPTDRLRKLAAAQGLLEELRRAKKR